MFASYFKIAWRNLWKNKTYTLINMLGLITGIACCLFIGLYIQHELSYDKFQQKGDRIVRMIMQYKFPGGEMSGGNYTSTKVLPAFVKNFPEVETGVRMERATALVRTADKEFEETGLMYADSTFFRMFSFSLLKGDSATALSGPYKVILTTSNAKKYFGDSNPIGQIIKIGASALPYEVTGIMADCPSNSQIQFGTLASFSSMGRLQEDTYWDANYTTYLLLKNSGSLKSFEAKIPGFMKQEIKDYGATITYKPEPFNSIHLHSPYHGFTPTISITYIYIITAVALLILCIACFTYINLSTARSTERSKEVGIRKVVGAGKQQILWQFMIESVLICLAALLISVGVVYLLLPAFNQLIGGKLNTSALFSPSLIAYALFLVVIIGLLAGSYPSFILSAFQPVKVLKGSSAPGSPSSWLRKTLIVFQFSISIILIIATFVIQSQLHYIQNTRLGYDRHQVMVLPMDGKVSKNLAALKNAFTANTDILSVSAATSAPTEIGSGYSMYTPAMGSKNRMNVTAVAIDEDYLKTTGIQLAAGSNFTQQEAADTNTRTHLLLNETAAKALGWTASSAIGKQLHFDNETPGIVKGVVKDFHFASLHNTVRPLVMFNQPENYTLLVKISGEHIPQTISHLQQQWKKLITHRPFNYHFLDEEFNYMYRSEQRLGNIVNVFSVIALFLACMGLLGLSSYAVYQRTKEIGIRKVLGATLTDITTLLSKDFLLLVFIAFLTAAPVAWYAMHTWLQQYAYRISIGWWIFALAGTGALLITLVTVSSQAIKAGLQNPVKTLKSE